MQIRLLKNLHSKPFLTLLTEKKQINSWIIKNEIMRGFSFSKIETIEQLSATFTLLLCIIKQTKNLPVSEVLTESKEDN